MLFSLTASVKRFPPHLMMPVVLSPLQDLRPLVVVVVNRRRLQSDGAFRDQMRMQRVQSMNTPEESRYMGVFFTSSEPNRPHYATGESADAPSVHESAHLTARPQPGRVCDGGKGHGGTYKGVEAVQRAAVARLRWTE